MNIYKKIYIFITLVVCLTTFPLVYMFYSAINEVNFEDEEQSFANISDILSSNITNAYFFLTHAEVSRITALRENLRDQATGINTLFEMLGRLPKLSQEEKLHWARQTIFPFAMRNQYVVLRMEDGTLLTSGQAQLDMGATLVDLKGRDLTTLLKKLPPRGNFAVFEVKQKDSITSWLTHFQPVLTDGPFKGTIIITASSIAHLDATLIQQSQYIATRTQEKFSHLSITPGSNVALVDSEGQALAYRGDENYKNVFLHAVKDYLVPGKAHSAIVRINGEETFLQTRHIKMLDWHIVASLPKSELGILGKNVVIQLMLAALGIMLLTLCLAFIFLRSTLSPLRVLSRSIEGFQRSAFQKEAMGSFDPMLLRHLPTGCKDELGQVARSFEEMARELSRHIHKLQIHATSEELLRQQLQRAAKMQKSMLPPQESTAPGWHIAALLEPAEDVSGDFFDYFPLDEDNMALVLGSTRGHGISAALLMSHFLTLSRQLLRHESNRQADASACLASVMENLQHSIASKPGKIRIFMAIYTTSTGRIHHINQGQPCPRILGASGPRPLSLPQGASYACNSQEDYPLAVVEDHLQMDEVLFCHGHGVTATLNIHGQRFGQENLDAFLQAHADSFGNQQYALPKLTRSMLASLEAFSQGAAQNEDVNLLLLLRIPQDMDKRGE